jgi:hypothetical protein
MVISYSENNIEQTTIVVDEAKDTLHLKGQVTGDVYFDFQLPFNINKIHPDYRDLNNSLEKVLVFYNENFALNDVCELRKGQGEEKRRIGLMFKPTIIFEPDSKYVYKEDKILKTTIFRSFGLLLNNESSLQSRTLSLKRDDNFLITDFFPEDIVVAVIPNEWYPNFQQPELTELLLNLYSYGFYFLNRPEDKFFRAPKQIHQKNLFETLVKHKGSHRKYLDVIPVLEVVKTNNYCNFYIQEIVKQSDNAIAKFYQIYGLVEIFKDEVLKFEIKEKICSVDGDLSLITGHKIKRMVSDISKDSYTVERLFGKYRIGSNNIIELLYLEILYFLETCREKSELESLKEFAQLFYFLRNIMVHDIQFLFGGDEANSILVRKELQRIVQEIEYVVLDTMKFLKLK